MSKFDASHKRTVSTKKPWAGLYEIEVEVNVKIKGLGGPRACKRNLPPAIDVGVSEAVEFCRALVTQEVRDAQKKE